MENEVTENKKLKIKLKFKQNIGMSVDITKYWHECQHCSRQHSNKSNIK